MNKLQLVGRRLAHALRAGQTVYVECNERCGGRVQLTLSAKLARKLGIKSHGGPVVVATGVHPSTSASAFYIVLRFKTGYRARLAKAKGLALVLTAALQDPAMNHGGRSVSVELTR